MAQSHPTDVEGIEPEKELLQFEISIDGTPPEVREAVLSIKKVAEKVLYHWKTFPIVLPPPVSFDHDAENPGRKLPTMRDLFIMPTFDEVEVVSVDNKGNRKKLNEKQLQSVQDNGEFEIESFNFPGQVHVWRLSHFLQKGRRKAQETFINDIALALKFIIVTAKNRIFSDFFSVSQSLMCLAKGFLQLLDIFIGIPSSCARDLDGKICEERSKYLVAELLVKPSLEEEVDNLCQFVKKQILKQKLEKYRLEQETAPPVPYSFYTPKGIEIDLRLFNKELMKKTLQILAYILEHEAKGWFPQFREKTIADLKTRKLNEDDIERQANILIMDEYLRRVYAAILSHPDVFCMGPGIGQLLVEHAQSIVLMLRAVERVQCKLNQFQQELESNLCSSYPVFSRIFSWLKEKLRDAEEKFIADNMWATHDEALQLCREHHLEQTIYFLQRDLIFMKEREPVLLKELSRVKIPNRIFDWHIHIWFPHNWVITRVHMGESEVIPTVISKSFTAASIRSDPNEVEALNMAFQPRYLIAKEATQTTSTQLFFWRWINYLYRTYSWLWNAMFIFGVLIPLCSPVSFRALFSVDPFMPDLEANSKGALIPRRSSLTQTLWSRLSKLWRHISKSRTEFEMQRDTGFLGKSISRHVNRLWNYVVKGFFGTLIIILVFPIVCLTVSVLSLTVAILAPVWVPVGTLIFHLCCMLFYDFDCPDFGSRNPTVRILEACVWRIIILGCIQPIIALITACIICPLVFLAILTVAVVRRAFRMLWDALMFQAVIKKRSQVPTSDSFVARRIAGPGLESNYYYQICSEQALAAFEAQLEWDELNAYYDQMDALIQMPLVQFSNFVKNCFQPFSAALVKENKYEQLEKEALDLNRTLTEKVDRRRQELHTGLSVLDRSKIKLTNRDLKITIKQAAIMLEKFYPVHVIKRLTISEEDFWDSKGLTFRDWPALAGNIFAEVFSEDFLTPLEDVDTKFRLEVHHLNLFRYTEMLRTAEYRDDLDVVSTVHLPKGNIHVHSPFLDISTFNPSNKRTVSIYNREGYEIGSWRRKHYSYSGKRFWIPLLIPHPAHITIIIYNRENEDPIPLESEQCQAILNAIEDNSNLGYEYLNVDLTPPDTQSLESHLDDTSGACGDTFSRMQRDDSVKLDGLTDGDQLSVSHLSGSINVNLASTEDITLEADGDCVTYSHSSYSTTV